MTNYHIVRAHGRTFIFATRCDYSSHIEIDTRLFPAETLLELFQENGVAPEHMQNVYDDLLFYHNML